MRNILRWLTSRIGARAVDRDRQEEDLKDELAFHFSTEVERRIAAGQSATEALASAKRDFGNVPLVEEVTRDMWGWSMQDYKLGVRMLLKYPGLTIAGGFALAVAIGIGAGWYEFSQQFLRPALPLPEGDRLVEIDMHDSLKSERERRLLHDFVAWRRDLRSIEDLGAYRTIARNLTVAHAQTEPVLLAETTASAFDVARVPPVLGRALIGADERPGAPGVVVLGYDVWQRWFGGRADAVGQEVRLGRATATVVGVMPEGFAFPVNHQAWVPLTLRPSGYAPLEGGAIRVFGRLTAGVNHREAAAELTTLAARAAAASPQTHEYLRPDVRAYGGDSSGARLVDSALTHLPILLVLIVACMTVGTLVYARTATREAEIAVRSALGASRRRIVTQLFVEALVLASAAAVVGLAAVHWALQWGMETFYSGQSAAPPFWMHSGVTITTVFYAAGLAVAAAAMLGILPALKATGPQVQRQLRNVGSAGSTLRFGGVWTTAMILQVALTVIVIPPAIFMSEEVVSNLMIRERFPAGEYLSMQIELDRASGSAEETESAFTERLTRVYGEFERRVAREPGVVAVTFADRLPGASPRMRLAQLEALPGAGPAPVQQLWTSTVGPGFFEAFERPILAGRDFHGGDRSPGVRTVIVNEAFARRFTNTASPIGRRVRYARSWANTDPDASQPWSEIVGMVRDIGMTPEDFGEAPFAYHAASLSTIQPAALGVRVKGDPAALASRVRAIAAEVEPGLRLDDVRRLDDVAWRADIDKMLAAGANVGAVGLGLFLSSAGIFSLMSVSVARRTREIGLRLALGASSASLLRGIFSRAVILVGSGVVAGNLVLASLVTLNQRNVNWASVSVGLLLVSSLMMTAGLLACVGPARRALRIHPTDALKEA